MVVFGMVAAQQPFADGHDRGVRGVNGTRSAGGGAVTRHWVLVDGLRLCARVPAAPPAAGSPAVLLVHGLGMSARYLLPTLRRLAPDAEVWAPDLPGFGDSDHPRRALSLPELADALAAWMDAVGLSRAAMLGNSLGCQVIGHLALQHPDRVTRAVLVGPTRDPRAHGPVGQAVRLLRDAPREAPSLIPLAVADYLRAGPTRMWRTLLDALSAHVEDRAPHVRVPVLVVRGQRDPIVPQRWAEELTALLPDARLVVIPGAAHAVNYSAPAALVDAVRPSSWGRTGPPPRLTLRGEQTPGAAGEGRRSGGCP